jgi:hypothetical protein
MNLINGRGQLGSALSSRELHIDNLDVYHTWNFLDKTEAVQKNEYEKFISYIGKVPLNRKVVFISTLAKDKSWYTYYKKLSEDVFLKRVRSGLVVRLPCMIGKGVFSNFRDQTIVDPYDGVVSFLTINECCAFILESLDKTGIVEPDCWNISANALCELVEFIKRK